MNKKIHSETDKNTHAKYTKKNTIASEQTNTHLYVLPYKQTDNLKLTGTYTKKTPTYKAFISTKLTNALVYIQT